MDGARWLIKFEVASLHHHGNDDDVNQDSQLRYVLDGTEARIADPDDTRKANGEDVIDINISLVD